MGSWGDLPDACRAARSWYRLAAVTTPWHSHEGRFLPHPISRGLVFYYKVIFLAENNYFVKTAVFCRNVADPPCKGTFRLFLWRQTFLSVTRSVIFLNQNWNNRSRSTPVSSSSLEIIFLEGFRNVFEASLQWWSTLLAIVAGSSSKAAAAEHPRDGENLSTCNSPSTPVILKQKGFCQRLTQAKPFLQLILFPLSFPLLKFSSRQKAGAGSSALQITLGKGRVGKPLVLWGPVPGFWWGEWPKGLGGCG